MGIERVLSGTPWTFNNHLLVLYKLKEGDDPFDSSFVLYYILGPSP